MRKPRQNLEVMDRAPTDGEVTAYDRGHLVTYMRLLDADAAKADWREVARLVLAIDPVRDEARARVRYDTHLSRARWLSAHGYRDLLSREKGN